MAIQRPVPPFNEVTRTYWQGCRQHRLLLQWCRGCGCPQFYPRSTCCHCHASDLEWRQASGRGSVYSFSVVHRPPSPAFADAVPYVVALIELEEGVRLMSNVTGCSPEGIEIGMPVEVVFEDLNEEIGLPLFRPVGRERGV